MLSKLYRSLYLPNYLKIRLERPPVDQFAPGDSLHKNTEPHSPLHCISSASRRSGHALSVSAERFSATNKVRQTQPDSVC